MGYNIEIKGSGSASKLIDALQRVIDELENEPTEEVSYSSQNEESGTEMSVGITFYEEEM